MSKRGCKYSHGIYYAVDSEGNRISIEDAERHGRGYFCELCHARLNPRKGEVRIWHYSHEKGKRCDPWAQPMSEWHRTWQERFPEETREIVIEREGEAHRADVYLEEIETVIEFQHSPISSRDFEIRNAFYASEGRSVIWVFDASKPFEKGHIEVWNDGLYGYDYRPPEWAEANLRWSWANKAFHDVTAHDLRRQRISVYLQLGEQSDEMPKPIAEVRESEDGFKYSSVTFMSIEECIQSITVTKPIEMAEINGFQKDLLVNHPNDFSAREKRNPLASVVVLRRKGDERHLTVAVTNDDDSVGVIFDKLPTLKKHYDLIDVIVDLRGWTRNRRLIAESVGCREYTGDFYRGRNNPHLVLKLKEEIRGYLEFPDGLRKLASNRLPGEGNPEFRLWACLAWDKLVPSSIPWVPANTMQEWCWPFVNTPGEYVCLVSELDGDARITVDARKAFPYSSFLLDIASGREIYIKACRFDKRRHEPPYVVESARGAFWYIFGSES